MFFHANIRIDISGMGSKADSPDAMFMRGRIVGMHEAGASVTEIGRVTGVDNQTVRKWIRRWEEEGRPLKTRPRSGRPRCTTRQDDSYILDAARRQPVTTAVEITRDLELPCSVTTTRRRLKEGGVHYYTQVQPHVSKDGRRRQGSYREGS